MKKNDPIELQFWVNDEQIVTKVSPAINLMQFLREERGLVGTKNGCETGHCGSCTVIVDGVARRGCIVKMKMVDGARIETIEGLAHGADLHPLQEAFIEMGAVQCGYCTPGMIMAGKALLDTNPLPSRDEIKKALTTNRNLCRCTGY
ncbi:MAG: (2Fe-2S)-binding protein, partial [Candidatus Hermodarchaeia archaeon]